MQLRHVAQMPPGFVPPSGEPRKDPRTVGETTSLDWPRNTLEFSLQELEDNGQGEENLSIFA